MSRRNSEVYPRLVFENGAVKLEESANVNNIASATKTSTLTSGSTWANSTGVWTITNSSSVTPAGWSTGSISLGNSVDNILIYKGKPMRYLYKAYVIDADDNITEVKPFIAKDEVSAKVKAILSAKADPDTAHVILQRLGEVPKAEKKDE